jgi:transcriptional regulator with XRE-family HTH domain
MDSKHYKDYVQIGLNILYYRKERGITQMQLAELTSFSRNHIQRIETASAVPSVAALLDIAKVLNVPVGKLFESR